MTAIDAGRVIELWVDGRTYADIGAELAARRGKKVDLPRTVAALSVLTDLLAWGVGSLAVIAKETIGGSGTIDDLVPYYIRFGVSHPVAAYLRLLGLSDRSRAMELAEAFPSDRLVTLESVEDWSHEEEAREAIRRLTAGNTVSRRALETDLGLDPTHERSLPVTFSMRSSADWLAVGTLLEISDHQLGAELREIVGGRSTFVTERPLPSVVVAMAKSERGWDVLRLA